MVVIAQSCACCVAIRFGGEVSKGSGIVCFASDMVCRVYRNCKMVNLC